MGSVCRLMDGTKCIAPETVKTVKTTHEAAQQGGGANIELELIVVIIMGIVEEGANTRDGG